MTDQSESYFLTYSGIGLPLKPVTPLEPGEIENRNTYFAVRYDQAGRIEHIRKIVYGDEELVHNYKYREDGSLAEAQITDADGETNVLQCDEQGKPKLG